MTVAPFRIADAQSIRSHAEHAAKCLDFLRSVGKPEIADGMLTVYPNAGKYSRKHGWDHSCALVVDCKDFLQKTALAAYGYLLCLLEVPFPKETIQARPTPTQTLPAAPSTASTGHAPIDADAPKRLEGALARVVEPPVTYFTPLQSRPIMVSKGIYDYLTLSAEAIDSEKLRAMRFSLMENFMQREGLPANEAYQRAYAETYIGHDFGTQAKLTAGKPKKVKQVAGLIIDMQRKKSNDQYAYESALDAWANEGGGIKVSVGVKLSPRAKYTLAYALRCDIGGKGFCLTYSEERAEELHTLLMLGYIEDAGLVGKTNVPKFRITSKGREIARLQDNIGGAA